MKNKSRTYFKAAVTVAISLAFWVSAGCTASSSNGEDGKGGEPGGPRPVPTGKIDLPKSVPAKIYRGSGSTPIDEMNSLWVKDLSTAKEVYWLSFPQENSTRLQSYGLYTVTTGSGCSSQIRIERDLVMFDNTGHIQKEQPVDDYNNGTFVLDPSFTNLLRVSIHGDFTGCEAVGASFPILPAKADQSIVELQSGHYEFVNNKFLKIVNEYPQLRASIGTENVATELYCFDSKCLGRDSQRRMWFLSLSSEDELRLRIVNADQSELANGYFEFHHGLNPRPVNPSAPILDLLSGSWLGETSDGAVAVKIHSSATESGRHLGFEFKIDGSIVETGTHVLVNGLGELFTECVWSQRPVGTHRGGDTFEFSLLNNGCQIVNGRMMKFQKLSSGAIQFDYFDGSKAYSSELTAW